MKNNKNYIDRIVNTQFICAATCKPVNGEKEYPFWLGLTDIEKHSKKYAQLRKNVYLREAKKRRELKAFVDKLTNDVDYRNLIKSRI